METHILVFTANHDRLMLILKYADSVISAYR